MKETVYIKDAVILLECDNRDCCETIEIQCNDVNEGNALELGYLQEQVEEHANEEYNWYHGTCETCAAPMRRSEAMYEHAEAEVKRMREDG